jgi:hypothetical protein
MPQLRGNEPILGLNKCQQNQAKLQYKCANIYLRQELTTWLYGKCMYNRVGGWGLALA